MSASAEEIAALEQVGHLTWPALEDDVVHGWRARAAGGVTRRSNSINPDGPPTTSVAEAVEAGIAWLAERGLPPTFRLTPNAPSEVEGHLQRLGLTRTEGAVIMTAPLPDRRPPASPQVEVSAKRSAEWSEILAGQADRAGAAGKVVARLLDAHTMPTGFALARVDGEPVAVGMTVVAGDHAGIFNMRTVPEHRRRGHGAAILRALMTHGRRLGATSAFIQVAPANTAAVELYVAAGFEERYRYWYYA